jgi:hypothetical protein
LLYAVAEREAVRNSLATLNYEAKEYAKTLSVEQLVNTYLAVQKDWYGITMIPLVQDSDRDLVLFYIEEIGREKARVEFLSRL